MTAKPDPVGPQNTSASVFVANKRCHVGLRSTSFTVMPGIQRSESVPSSFRELRFHETKRKARRRISQADQPTVKRIGFAVLLRFS